MRTAFISDIHGHYRGLELVLTDIAERNCDRLVCLGDLVDGGEEDERVVLTVQELKILCVQGNHDAQSPSGLPPSARDFLASLPRQWEEDDLLFCHISSREKPMNIRNAIEAWNVFDESSHRLLFTGHQHVPMIYGQKNDSFGEARVHDFLHNQAFQLDPSDRYIICVGAVAYGRDSVGQLRYAIYDSARETLEHRSVNGPLLSRDYTLKR